MTEPCQTLAALRSIPPTVETVGYLCKRHLVMVLVEHAALNRLKLTVILNLFQDPLAMRLSK